MEKDPKSKIIDATVKLVNDHPDGLPSIREIAQEAEVSLGLINYYFKSRERLIRAAVRQHIERNVIMKFNPADNGVYADSRKLLAKIILGPLDYIAQHPKLARISIITDFLYPEKGDNIHLTFKGIEASLSGIFQHPLTDKERLNVWTVIGSIHEAFLRPALFKHSTGFDLMEEKNRESYAEYLASILLTENQ